MAPSRGSPNPTSNTPSPTPQPLSAPPPEAQTSTEKRAIAGESSALASVRRNMSYLYDPHAATSSPTRLRTRALLRMLHYSGVFLFWRAVRWAKYAVIGSLVAAVGSMAFAGSLASGVGFIIAPTGIFASIAVGTAWGVGRWVWRWVWRKWDKSHQKQGDVTLRDTMSDKGLRRLEAKDPALIPW